MTNNHRLPTGYWCARCGPTETDKDGHCIQCGCYSLGEGADLAAMNARLVLGYEKTKMDNIRENASLKELLTSSNEQRQYMADSFNREHKKRKGFEKIIQILEVDLVAMTEERDRLENKGHKCGRQR